MKRYFLIGAAVFFALSAPLSAELITVHFNGSISYSYDPNGHFPGIDLCPVTGYYTYDTNTPDEAPEDPTTFYGAAEVPPAALAVHIGGYTFEFEAGSQFRLAVINGTDSWDRFVVDGVPPYAEPFEAALMSVGFLSRKGTALSSDALPTGTPVWSSWDFATPVVWDVEIAWDITSVAPGACCHDGGGCTDVNVPDECPESVGTLLGGVSCSWNPCGSVEEEIIATTGGTVETPDGAVTLEIDAGDWGDRVYDISLGGAGAPVAVYSFEPDTLEFCGSVDLCMTVGLS